MEQKHGKISALAALLTAALFVLCLLAVLLTGAESYRKVAEQGETAFAQRTAAGYLTARLRQGDTAGAVTVENFGSVDALALREQIGQERYVTRIYCREGYLWELYCAEDGDFLPEDGEPLVQLAGLELTQQDSLLTVGLRHPDGSAQTLIFSLRSQEEVLP